MMRTSNAGKVEIVGHEAICLSKYLDSVGVWTIGIGATRTEIPDIAKWPLSKTITIQEAFDLLERGIVKYENAINAALTRKILQTQFDALVSWCYNVGVGWVPKASVIKLINQGAGPNQLYDALMMYQKPKAIRGRRKKEALLLSHGIYSNGGMATLAPVSSRGYPLYSLGKLINVWEYLDKKTEAQPVVPVVPKSMEKQFEDKPEWTLARLANAVKGAFL